MAARNINVTITVNDAASSKMRQVEAEMKKMGKTTENLNNNFLKFNRTLFTTTAFIGTFVGAFRGLHSSITEGANLQRVTLQFERAFGKNADIVKTISKFTDTAVDEFEAMQSALELHNMGLVSSSDEAAKAMALGAAAARKNGQDSSEGIKAITQFYKTHDITALQSIGVVNKANKEFLIQQGILGSMGTPMNAAIKSGAAFSMGLKLLQEQTKGVTFGFEDLNDILKRFSSNFKILKSNIGIFLGTIFTPLLKHFSDFAKNLSDSIKDIDKINPQFITMAKMAGYTTVSLAALVATLGTLKLVTISLGSLGFGLPKLISLLLVGAGAFKSITDTADNLTKRLELFTGFIKGVFQLVTSFNKETGFSKIDKDLQALLQKHGLLTFTENIARAITVVRYFVTDVGQKLIDWGSTAFSWINSVTDAFKSFFSIDSGPWSRNLIEGTGGVRGALVGLTAGLTGVLALKKLLSFAGGGGLFSKIPIIGRLFGGGGRPSGTASDPIYTRSADGILGSTKGFLYKYGGEGLGKLLGALNITKALGLASLGHSLKRFGQIFVVITGRLLQGNFKAAFSVLDRLGPILFNFGRAILGTIWPLLAVTAVGYGMYKLTGILVDLIPAFQRLGPAMWDFINAESEKRKLDALSSDQAILDKINENRKNRGEVPLTMEQYKRGEATKRFSSKTGAEKSQVSTGYNIDPSLDLYDKLATQVSDIKDSSDRAAAEAMLGSFARADSEGGRNITEKESQRLLLLIASFLKSIDEKTDSKTFENGRSKRD